MKLLLLTLVVFAFQFSVSGQDKAHYKIRSENCGDDNKCFVFAYVKAKHYNEANMQKLAEELAAKYKGKAIVNFNIFDSEQLIEAFLEGKRSPSQIQVDRRAYFLHSAACGDLLFYKPENNKLKTVRVSWKNTEQCNKPFAV